MDNRRRISMFFKRRFLPYSRPFFAGRADFLWEDRPKMPAQVLLQVIWDKKRSRATSQKIPHFPSSGASWMRADISVALLSWGTSQTVIREALPRVIREAGYLEDYPFF